MRLTVEQTTTLRFESPQLAVMQSRRVTPADYKGQTVLDWSVTGTQATLGAAFRDGAGDLTSTATFAGPLDEVSVTLAGTVETTDRAGVLGGLRERIAPVAYLRTTRATRTDKALLDLGRAALDGREDSTLLDHAHALAEALSDVLDHGTDDGEDTRAAAATEVLAAGSGSCRAQAHALIALAIALDIPARFAFGFVLAGTPEDGRDALVTDSEGPHGWAELHVGKLGWVGFDVANACCPDDRYVRLCSGFDAEDAAPMRTVASGTPDSDTEITVAAVAAGQVQQ